MSVVPAVPVAASGNAFVDAQERLNELNLRAVAVLTHVEAGITRPKDALPQDADNAERAPACRPSAGHSRAQCRPVTAFGRHSRA